MKRQKILALIGAVLLLWMLALAACSGAAAVPNDATDAPLTRPPTDTGPALSSILVSPNSINLLVGETQKLTVTANYADGSSVTISGNCDYFKSDNTVVATVTSGGVITAVAPGTATITISYTKNGVTQTDTAHLDVFPRT